jgi:hypothetical protein
VNSPEIHFTDQIWDSLKIPIMIIAALAPIIIAILAFRFKRTLKALQTKHQSDQRIYEKRMGIYDRMGPKLNDLFCFYCYNGNWKEITPMDVIRIKKELDKEINTHAPLFSDDLGKKYTGFVQLCFVAHSGWEHEEKIKSHYEIRQESNAEWKEDWIPYFDTNNVVDAIRMKERYDELIESFKKNLNPTSS